MFTFNSFLIRRQGIIQVVLIILLQVLAMKYMSPVLAEGRDVAEIQQVTPEKNENRTNMIKDAITIIAVGIIGFIAWILSHDTQAITSIGVVTTNYNEIFTSILQNTELTDDPINACDQLCNLAKENAQLQALIGKMASAKNNALQDQIHCAISQLTNTFDPKLCLQVSVTFDIVVWVTAKTLNKEDIAQLYESMINNY